MKKKIIFLISALIFILIIIKLTSIKAYGATIPIPNIDLKIDSPSTPKDYVDNIKLLIWLTILSLLPSFIIMMTSFTRIIVVFGFLRSAMGTQQSPPNQVLVGLAIFLTIFIMTPVYKDINDNAIKPYLNNTITQKEALDIGSKPLREFMLRQTRNKDLKLFSASANIDENISPDDMPLYVVIPAYTISELKTAFLIGFILYIPFLVVDLVVASILMSMGMFMLPPVMVSLPFKLLLFVMVDGWYLIVESLIKGFK